MFASLFLQILGFVHVFLILNFALVSQENILNYFTLFFLAVMENSLSDEFIIKSLHLRNWFVLVNSLREIKTYK